jgi:hypothetical protein
MVEFWPHTIEILLAIDDPREIIGMGNVAGSDGCVSRLSMGRFVGRIEAWRRL